jgi:hypothetical protein
MPVQSSSHPFGSVEASTDRGLVDTFISVPHAVKALQPSVSILTGRRAAGKTAIAVHIEQGDATRFDLVVHFEQRKLLAQLLLLKEQERLNRTKTRVIRTSLTSDQFVEFWMFSIWHTIAVELGHFEHFLTRTDRTLFAIIVQEIEQLSEAGDTLLASAGVDQYARDMALLTILDRAQRFKRSYTFAMLLEMVEAYLEAGHRIVVLSDTVEDYRVRNELMDRALAGLLMACAEFAGSRRSERLQVKCFFPAEIYSYLKFQAPFNIRKVEQHMVHLRWTNKQLRRMLSIKVAHWLNEYHREHFLLLGLNRMGEAEVERTVWTQIFPAVIINKQGVEEDTFIYIARHTQLHPGQLIWLCNVIAEKASDDGVFPRRIDPKHVIEGVNAVESNIATSVLGPYSPVYPQIAVIFQAAFGGMPNLISYRDFSELHKKALHVWPQKAYPADPHTFERMALETGVVGKLRNPPTEKYYVSYFEYDSGDELNFSHDDLYAIHPAFYEMLSINTSGAKKFVCPNVVVNHDNR